MDLSLQYGNSENEAMHNSMQPSGDKQSTHKNNVKEAFPMNIVSSSAELLVEQSILELRDKLSALECPEALRSEDGCKQFILECLLHGSPQEKQPDRDSCLVFDKEDIATVDPACLQILCAEIATEGFKPFSELSSELGVAANCMGSKITAHEKNVLESFLRDEKSSHGKRGLERFAGELTGKFVDMIEHLLKSCMTLDEEHILHQFQNRWLRLAGSPWFAHLWGLCVAEANGSLGREEVLERLELLSRDSSRQNEPHTKIIDAIGALPEAEDHIPADERRLCATLACQWKVMFLHAQEQRHTFLTEMLPLKDPPASLHCREVVFQEEVVLYHLAGFFIRQYCRLVGEVPNTSKQVEWLLVSLGRIADIDADNADNMIQDVIHQIRSNESHDTADPLMKTTGLLANEDNLKTQVLFAHAREYVGQQQQLIHPSKPVLAYMSALESKVRSWICVGQIVHSNVIARAEAALESDDDLLYLLSCALVEHVRFSEEENSIFTHQDSILHVHSVFVQIATEIRLRRHLNGRAVPMQS